MWKGSYVIKLLLSLLLIPGLLVGCALEIGNSPGSNQGTENPLNRDGQNLEESFKDIQETYKQFQELLENFLGEIDQVRNGSKNRESVNSNEVNKKLKELEAKINQYKNNLQTTDAPVSGLFNDINRIVTSIEAITEELKGGLGREAIGEVQIYLEVLLTRSEPYYGVLGPGTTAAINESLKGNSQQLEKKLIELPKTTGSVGELASTKTIEALSAKVAILETEVRELRNKTKNNQEGEIATISARFTTVENQLEQTKAQIAMIFIFSVVASGLAVISMCFATYKLFEPNRTRKKLRSSGSDKKHGAASQADSTIKENIPRAEANQTVDKQLSSFSIKYDNEIDRGNQNIPQAKQNKETNIPPSPAQSSTPTSRAIPPASPVETTQYQQRYSSGYPSSSGPQLVSAYNNDPGSFSNNGIAVEETKQSIEQRRLGGNQPIVFEKNRRGNYSIVKEGAVEYMVPKSKLKINEFNRQAVAVLFECQGYRPEYSGFQLIKPARVYASRGESWQLVEPGVLQFY